MSIYSYSQVSRARFYLREAQGDQIGQNFAIWAIFYGIGQIFISKKSPNDLGKILASHEKIAQNWP